MLTDLNDKVSKTLMDRECLATATRNSVVQIHSSIQLRTDGQAYFNHRGINKAGKDLQAR